VSASSLPTGPTAWERGWGERRRTAARVAVGVVAALLCAWFAVLARDSLLARRAQTAAADRHATAAAWQRGLNLLGKADFLNPGTDRQAQRVAYLVAWHRPAEARRLALSIARREPDNIAAWKLLAVATPPGDPVHARAMAEISRLDPLDVARMGGGRPATDGRRKSPWQRR